jgi:hypothetical protein
MLEPVAEECAGLEEQPLIWVHGRAATSLRQEERQYAVEISAGNVRRHPGTRCCQGQWRGGTGILTSRDGRGCRDVLEHHIIEDGGVRKGGNVQGNAVFVGSWVEEMRMVVWRWDMGNNYLANNDGLAWKF